MVPRLGEAWDFLSYDASAGERNRVTLRWAGEETSQTSGVWVVNDPGAPVAAGESCTAVDEHTVECRARPGGVAGERRPISAIRIKAEDLDDEVSWIGANPASGTIVYGGAGDDQLLAGSSRPWSFNWLYGEAGADRVVGGAGAQAENELYGGDGDDELASALADSLFGGAGDDRLLGGRRADALDGGGGRDHLLGRGGSDTLDDGDRSAAAGDAGPGPDIIDGGRGRDAVSYTARRRALTVDLADRGPDGERDEGDRLIGIEDVYAGRGDDRVAGDERRNNLRGGSGRDRLEGRGGSDHLWTGGGGERLACGAAEDVIWGGVSRIVYVDADCELLNGVPIVDAPYPQQTRRRSLSYSVSCPVDEYDGVFAYQCSGSLRLREASGMRRLLATATFGFGKWQERKVRLRLTPVGFRLAARRNGVWATVALRARTRPTGYPPTTRERWTIRLKSPD